MKKSIFHDFMTLSLVDGYYVIITFFIGNLISQGSELFQGISCCGISKMKLTVDIYDTCQNLAEAILFPGRNNGRNFSGIRALTAVKISHRSRY